MNYFLTDMIKYALGWTLLHTLWQGAIIFGLTKTMLSFISDRNARLRYAVNCMSLFLIISGSILTFSYLYSSPLSIASSFKIEFTDFTPPAQITIKDAESFLAIVSNAINDKMVWIVTTWIVGMFLFSARFFIGLLYIQQLKRKVIAVSAEWEQKMKKIAMQMGVVRVVRLGESIHISKPVILGYAKPVVLLPLGLLTGLPTAQIETILLHELSHIKRHDFLVNIIQSIIEVILFFNPFVWMISEMIRKEREHCCDDQVVSRGSSRIEYARALAQLEEVNQHGTPAFALALNKNKFHVFNRIKRIMETSQNHSKAKPIIMVALIAIGLLSASWLTIDSNEDAVYSKASDPSSLVADTIIQKDKGKTKEGKSATYSRKVITTYDKDGRPHKEVTEDFEGDEELRPLLSDSGHLSFSVPAVPGIPTLPMIPAVPSIPAIPAIPDVPFHMGHTYRFDGDTLPNHFFSPEDSEKWEEFSHEMEKRFEDFGVDNKEFGRMMEEWGERFGDNFQFHFNEDFADQLEALSDRLKGMDFNHDFEFKFQDNFNDMEEHLNKAKEKIKEHESELNKAEGRMKEFEKALQDQLIKDGYLKKGEKVESVNWGDGKLFVNGIKIKDKDIQKYKELSEKYFNGNHR